MDSLRNEKDISIAIVASAIVEAALERVITAKFKRASKSLIGQVFSSQGPLSSFNSEIQIAQVFGIITPPLAAEMHSIEAIRKTFAHAKMPVSFAEAAIANEVVHLKLVSSIKPALSKRASKEMTEKSDFLLTTEIIPIILDCLEKDRQTADEALAAALKG